MGTAFSGDINAMNLHKGNMVNSKKMATLTHITQIQEEYFEHLE
jgi:hypothetical protein